MMKVTVLNKPKLIAVIKASGIKSPVEWIDLEGRRCKTSSGFESDIDDFEFIDNRDYDELRGDYAGRAMQAMIGGMMGNLTLLEQMNRRAVREGYKLLGDMIAVDAVTYADSLINELKRPKGYKEMFGLTDKTK